MKNNKTILLFSIFVFLLVSSLIGLLIYFQIYLKSPGVVLNKAIENNLNTKTSYKFNYTSGENSISTKVQSDFSTQNFYAKTSSTNFEESPVQNDQEIVK